MSKSIGNTVIPDKVMKQLGADILRLWVASVDYQADVRVSDDILKQVAEVYRKIRNTFRFMLGNLHDFDPSKDAISFEDMSELDQFMMIKLNNLVRDVRKGYDEFQFGSVYNKVHNYCTIELSSFYMDIAKDTLYIQYADHPDRRGIQTVMYETLKALTQLMAPVLAHTADEVWKEIPGVTEASVQLTDIPDPKEYPNSENLVAKWDRFMDLRDDVLKALEEARKEKGIKKSLETALEIYADGEDLELLKGIASLNKLFITSKAVVAGGKNEAPAEAKEYEFLKVTVESAEGEKCERCWVVAPSLGKNDNHPGLCDSCTDIVVNHYE